MSEPFLAEVRIMGFDFPPRGWAFCDGQILPINQNQSLFSLLGTTYGGDGRTSFALPDLRSRTPVHTGGDPYYKEGHRAGSETVTLTAAQIPSHTHTVQASSSKANVRQLENNILATGTALDGTTNQNMYREYEATNSTALRSGTVENSGGGKEHENMQPYTTLAFAIALQGLFPSRN